ncbi:MAG: fasciclin domain-containing protein, partial [Gaiellales bacterium]
MHRLLPLGMLLALVAAFAAPASAARTAAPSKNIVQTAVSAGQFTTLVTLVKKAGLVGALSGKAKLTVFAPTNAAFAKVPKATLKALAANPMKLKAVLLYHVVKGRVTAAQASKLTSAATLEGQRVKIRLKGGSLFVNGAK